MNTISKNTVVVIGIGRLGASIAKELSSDGESVLCVDANPLSFNKLEDFSGFTELGDATDLEFLKKLDISRAKSIIITTDSDDVNIFLGHVCFMIFNSLSIYIRLSDSNKSKLLKGTPINAIYPFLLSLDDFMNKFKGENIWRL